MIFRGKPSPNSTSVKKISFVRPLIPHASSTGRFLSTPHQGYPRRTT
uniref:Uncharacterized protein n=1 Tax=Arundo donax TaxID=35708 RepID=A0A0A8ZFE0_ARUDO